MQTEGASEPLTVSMRGESGDSLRAAPVLAEAGEGRVVAVVVA